MPSFLPRMGLGGIGGIGQMSGAAVNGLARPTRAGQTRMMGSSKRRKKKAAANGAKKRRRKSNGGKAKLKKGSAAAKAYMAKIRKMRKK